MSGKLDEEALQVGEPTLQHKLDVPGGEPAPDTSEEGSSGRGQNPGRRELQQKAEIIEGKREKKSVQRLDLQIGKPTEPVKIEDGKGMKLGDIVQVAYFIARMKADELKPFHKILFNRPGAVASLKKNIRQFNGFSFEANSEPYNKKREVLKRLTMAGLKNICTLLDLETSGTHDVRVDRILTFLLNPKTRERPSPKKRKKASSSKSKAIVIDSSSDDDVAHGDKDRGSAPKSRETIDDDDSTSDDNDDKDVVDSDQKADEDNATEKMDPTRKTPTKQKTSGAKKTSAKKLTIMKKKPTGRKTPGGKKKMESIKAVSLKQKSKAKISKVEEEELSLTLDQSMSENDSDQEEKPKNTKKRPAAPLAKPAAKTKKADSSSSKMTGGKSKGSDAEEDSSDDEPLIKLLKKPPTDEQLRETINKLLKDANLEEVTMKQMYKKVFETYPEYDLTSRKAFIKQTVKKFIS